MPGILIGQVAEALRLLYAKPCNEDVFSFEELLVHIN